MFVVVPAKRLATFKQHLDSARLHSIGYLSTIRLVTHLDIGDAAIDCTLEVVADL